jgi:hypothetical protein
MWGIRLNHEARAGPSLVPCGRRVEDLRHPMVWRFARRERIAHADLREAVRRAERGLFDADLGGGVIKQRIARPHEGKRGGVRSIILFRKGDRAFFVYGFAKSARATIRPDELLGFKRLAAEMLSYDDDPSTSSRSLVIPSVPLPFHEALAVKRAAP